MAEFRPSRLKIERAEEHIADVNAAIKRLENTSVATIEHRPDGGQSLKYEIPEFKDAVEKMSLIVGDALHNLRSAIDLSWVNAIKRLMPDVLSSNSKFPARRTRKDVEDALHGIDVDTRCRKLFDLVVFTIQPYEGGHNEVLWTLHDLDIWDKHRLLLGLDPSGQIRAVTMRDANGELHRGSSMPEKTEGCYIIDFEKGLEIEHEGILRVAVTLQEAGNFRSIRVTDLLCDFRNFTRYTVKLLDDAVCF